jgi:hypothetical protein
MTAHRTSMLHKLGHPEVSVTLSEHIQMDVRWLLSFFETEVQNGRRFNSLETIQIGWMVVTLKASVAGDLEVWEPQFDSFPVRWIKGANNTLRHLILQKSVCEQFGCEPNFPSLLQSGVVSPRFLDKGEGFLMSRDQPSNNDSGWVFSTPEESVGVDSGEHRSLFEIFFYHTEVIAFLAMPPGSEVLKTNCLIEATFNGHTLSSKNNDLLRKICVSSILV